jgi:cellulose synthase/poly-beta-1,6-N-acetylglucosamine synthase-like glycosyltransferase
LIRQRPVKKDVQTQIEFASSSLPFISVVVAARNEEPNILECLNALSKQSYPKTHYEVWIGDDQSEDETRSIVKSFADTHPDFHLLEVNERLKHLRGKANVLAQLIRKAKGEILLITDADVVVNSKWIETLTKAFDGSLSMITGVTIVSGRNVFAALQRAEWIFNVGNGHLQSEKGKPVTAIGNNMGFTRQIYDLVGGYENIPFSITEDLELYLQIRSKGGIFKTIFDPDALAYTKPVKSFRTLFNQRKRWTRGIFQLPTFLMAGLLFIHNLLPIIIILGLIFGWQAFVIILILKWIADIFFLRTFYKKLSIPIDRGTLLYTPYSLLFNTLFLCYYFFPSKVSWKGRKY